ncbi:MAG: hypothetical protein M3Y68_13750, partial [Chloroflexota bacterium]|nr:hypothetical protein [Chloroflexota bacterium]
MLNNFRNLQSLYQSLGARWLMFRVGYALRMRTGLIRKQNPSYTWQERPLQLWLRETIPSGTKDYAGWRTQNSPGFFFRVPQAGRSGSITESQILGAVSWDPHIAEQEAERILDGEIRYFAHESIMTGFPPDWHRDPFSGRKVDVGRHWSQISNDGDVDIKFIWEASRFSMV